jgi:hypothetical protein
MVKAFGGKHKSPCFTLKYGMCPECHKLGKISGYICVECKRKSDRVIYNRDRYIKRKNKAAFIPQEAAIGIGAGGTGCYNYYKNINNTIRLDTS